MRRPGIHSVEQAAVRVQHTTMAAVRGVRFAAGDIFDTPDDGLRYEVLEGELFLSPAPIPRHQRIVGRVFLRVGLYVEQHRLGELFPAPIGLVLSDEDGLQPDSVFVSRERRHIVTERGVEGAPDLVVEVLSPRTAGRDRGVKLRRYAAAGIPHYWLFDGEAREVEELALGEHGDARVAVLRGPGATFRPALFPGLAIPLDELWG